MEFLENLQSDIIYSVDDIKFLCSKAPKTYVQKRKKKIYNIPCAFDIETTSFYDNGEKRACMYVWQFGLNGYVIMGRTWSEFILLCDKLVEYLQLDKCRLIVYVHNLGYEFQFMRKWFQWQKVFCIGSRTPAYARTKIGIEFRDSYMLSGYSLEKTAEQIHCTQIRKMVGDLDYSIIRNSKTVLTPEEIRYCVYDVKVVMAYIYDKIQQDNGINRIPMTKTGYVRNLIKKYFAESKKDIWKVRDSTLTVHCYESCVRAMMGGFVHANPKTANRIIKDVFSVDFTSSYPYVILSEKFPIEAPKLIEKIDKQTFNDSIDYYCCIFDIEFTKLEPIVFFDNYISENRCQVLENPVINNGRVVFADRLITTITNVDFKIIRRFYKWEKMRVRNFYRWKRDYLPKPIIQAVLDLYQIKTELKGVAGKEVEYLHGKENINSVYGCMVTSIVMDLITYEDDYIITEPDLNQTLEKYNKNFGRTLYYPWGVFVTAYARRNIISGVLEFADDYLYSDTDSIKGINFDKHKPYIDKYNALCDKKLRLMCEHYNIDFSRTRPKTIKGIEKPLGWFDLDGEYLQFKTLGAKRYAYQTSDGNYHFTVSGINEKFLSPYMEKTYPDNILENFTNNLMIDAENSGKKTHTYIDDITQGYITDYQGHTAQYSEMSSIHIEKQPYSLKISNNFLQFIEKVMFYEKRTKRDN